MQINRLDDYYERIQKKKEGDINPKFNLFGKYGTKYKYLNPIDYHLKTEEDSSELNIDPPNNSL